MSALVPALVERQHAFEHTFLPIITGVFGQKFHHLDPDAREEAVQDSVLSAWKIVAGAAPERVWDGHGNRVGRITPGTVVNFVVKAKSTGRGGVSSSRCDVLDPSCQRLGRARVCSPESIIENAIEHDEEMPAAMLTKPSSSPVDQARAHIDWGEIGKRCTRQGRRVLVMLAKGCPSTEIAQRLGVSPSRICHIKVQIAQVVRALGYAPA